MDITEILQITDHLFFSQTRKHLDDLQEAVIKGVWQGQTYQIIADECQHSESRIRDVGYELWKVLSKALGEDIKKTNFRSTFERLNFEKSQNSLIFINSNNHDFCNRKSFRFIQNDKQHKENIINSQLNYHDLTLAPKIIKFYNRETELQSLSNWILNQNTSLISVLGLSGIGKSYLVKRFIDLNLDQFEVIIWRSLKYPDSLDELIDDILNIGEKEIKPNSNNKLKQLFDSLANQRYLILLDDVHNIFISGQFAGQYQPEYQAYQNFFSKIIETEHQSHVILISQEKCKEMNCLDEELYPVKCLELSGLDSTDILSDLGLKDENSWLDLINLYEGNPFYLRMIANSINTIYDGKVSEFLEENTSNTDILPVITTQIQANLELLFNRLSPTEQKMLIKLGNSEKLLSREELKTSLDLSSTDLINSLESLQQRYLITKITSDTILFKLSPIFREYVKTYLQNCL